MANETVTVEYIGEYAGEPWFEKHLLEGADAVDGDGGYTRSYQFTKRNKFTIQMAVADADRLAFTGDPSFKIATLA